ncbi:nitroreductase family protein [Paenibacillus andongensis]|uniref:nitroreductase family protein n=1 Tax=Paenibacillus andongensis TaxID=2975482 RepID=UPI0021BA7158|nr:nitroreductase family protein [Paenibacillus andongensis]
MSSINQTDFLTIVKERHSVKHYDASHNMSEQEIKELLEIAISAPSAWNLQHWKFLAIIDQAAKEKLLPIAYGQKQVVEAAVVVAILGDLQANLNAEAIYGPDVAAGLLPEKVKLSIFDQIEYQYNNVPTAPRDEAIRNASLAAMQLMLAAKAKGLDSGPMGGYDAEQFVEAFDVPSRYVPVMLVAIGKAAQPARPSSRLPVEQTIVWNHF